MHQHSARGQSSGDGTRLVWELPVVGVGLFLLFGPVALWRLQISDGFEPLAALVLAVDLGIPAAAILAGIEAWVWGDDSWIRAVVERTSTRLYAAVDWPFAPWIRTVLVVLGVGPLLLCPVGIVLFLWLPETHAPIGLLTIIFAFMMLYIGLFLVGIGVLLPGRGGTFTIPPVRLSSVQRILVTGGVLLLAPTPLLPLVGLLAPASLLPLVGLDLYSALLGPPASYGVRFLFVGLVWAGIEAGWRLVRPGRCWCRCVVDRGSRVGEDS